MHFASTGVDFIVGVVVIRIIIVQIVYWESITKN